MKNPVLNCLKITLLFIVILLSTLTLCLNHYCSEFDPIREIQKLGVDNRRDDALDLTHFFQENQCADQNKLSQIEEELNYSVTEKIKSITWNGAIKGQVYDTYSGLGAISADLCVIGDIRDLGIQSWKYLFDREDFDSFIFILSAAGIGLTSTPFLDGTDALAKCTVKYLKRIPDSMNKGLLNKFIGGNVSPANCKQIWSLLKKTSGTSPEPYPACLTSRI